MTRKRIPIDGNMLRQKTLIINEVIWPQNKTEEEGKSFTVSKSWLYRFKTWFNLKNIKITGNSASGDERAAASFPEESTKIIVEKDYHPKQVFNWNRPYLEKNTPTDLYIHKTAKQAPGFKAFKDRLTLVLMQLVVWSNLALFTEHKIHRALKNKNKSYLPVYWQSNREAWVTAVLFTEWFHQCFIPEVKRYLEKEELYYSKFYWQHSKISCVISHRK